MEPTDQQKAGERQVRLDGMTDREIKQGLSSGTLSRQEADQSEMTLRRRTAQEFRRLSTSDRDRRDLRGFHWALWIALGALIVALGAWWLWIVD